MTEQEALAAALDRSAGLDQLHPNDAFGAGFHAALAWLRSQREPIAVAQPAIPEGIRTAIGELLTHAMDIAVKNGADSRSMPDEYVTVAAWLCGIEPQPAGPDQQGEVK